MPSFVALGAAVYEVFVVESFFEVDALDVGEGGEAGEDVGGLKVFARWERFALRYRTFCPVNVTPVFWRH
jgi:hypothetical protein